MDEPKYNRELVAKIYIKHGKATANLVKHFFQNTEEFKGGIIVDRIGLRRKRKLLDWQKRDRRKNNKED